MPRVLAVIFGSTCVPLARSCKACYACFVIVPAMEDSEASGFRFAPLGGNRCWHSGERRPEAFVRLVFFVVVYAGCARSLRDGFESQKGLCKVRLLAATTKNTAGDWRTARQ